jgi:hypothetical protein
MLHFRPTAAAQSDVDPRVRAIFWRCYCAALFLVIGLGCWWGLA